MFQQRVTDRLHPRAQFAIQLDARSSLRGCEFIRHVPLDEVRPGRPDNKIIVTTIQKLNNLMKSEADLPIYQKHVVFIFDECHRSQFGEAQNNLKRKFKRLLHARIRPIQATIDSVY